MFISSCVSSDSNLTVSETGAEVVVKGVEQEVRHSEFTIDSNTTSYF